MSCKLDEGEPSPEEKLLCQLQASVRCKQSLRKQPQFTANTAQGFLF